MKSTFGLITILSYFHGQATAKLLTNQTSFESISSMLLQFTGIALSLLIGILVPYLIYTFVIKPYLAIRFYRQQGIPMQYSPVIGSFSRDLDNAREKGDYYYDWIQLAKQEPRPKAMGKNISQNPQLYLIDPEAVRQFFMNHESYIKHPFLNALTKELGQNGLVMAEGQLWRKHRKLMSNAFQFDMLKGVVPDVVKHSLEIVGNYQKKNISAMKIFDEFRDTAGEVIGRIFFEESLGQYTMQGIPMTLFLSNLLSRVTSEAYDPLYLMFGLPLVKTKIIPKHRKLINDIREFRQWCRGIVQRNMTKRREDHKKGLYPYEGRKTLFDLFFDHELACPAEALCEDELVDEYITVFSDGVYTTGHFISMCTYYLEKNPEWKQKVIEEMDAIFPDITKIDFDGISRMDTLAACMKETHRLAPPVVTAIERIALFDHDLAGIQVKKGTILMACHSANHLDERFFEDASTYNPERWITPSKTQESVTKYPALFIPFSSGARRCIGQNFAMNEAKVLLTIFMRKYKYELADKSYELKFTQRFLREPLDPIVYKLTPRETAN